MKAQYFQLYLFKINRNLLYSKIFIGGIYERHLISEQEENIKIAVVVCYNMKLSFNVYVKTEKIIKGGQNIMDKN